jgi:anionic glutamate receptor
MEKAKRIDVTSRVLFPLIFAFFNVAYWTTYLLQANAEFEATLKS